jgi:hypothetical protein
VARATRPSTRQPEATRGRRSRELRHDPDPKRSQRGMQAMMKLPKLDIAARQQARDQA